GRLRRALERFGHYWRRSGGRLAQAQGDRLTQQVAAQLAQVRSWDEFINARIVLDPDRSEEHTSELQSRVDLVCRRLLEKKRTTASRRRRPGRRRRWTTWCATSRARTAA